MIRKHKLYKRPRKLFDISRIKDEDELVKKYGLKNKKEIWKAKAKPFPACEMASKHGHREA